MCQVCIGLLNLTSPFVTVTDISATYRNLEPGDNPLLFSLFILMTCQNVLSKLSFTQFADDSSIFITGKNLKEMSNLMTDQMKRVSDWLQINMLTLNVSKTNYMIMCNRGKKVADAD